MLEVVEVESDNWTIPAIEVVAAVDALSNAALTAVGVAARTLDVVEVESLNCTTPVAAVEAALTPIVTAPELPPPVIGEVTLTAVMSPTSLVIHVKSKSVFDVLDRI
jgi:hypothetical protein